MRETGFVISLPYTFLEIIVKPRLLSPFDKLRVRRRGRSYSLSPWERVRVRGQIWQNQKVYGSKSII